mmetsp:Transcript_31005/g.74899  ORF Transcript_31005/g.74899 Transcript_31005/m.74899 type:complete len:394 (+) Transcript_31005:22-1203(+)
MTLQSLLQIRSNMMRRPYNRPAFLMLWILVLITLEVPNILATPPSPSSSPSWGFGRFLGKTSDVEDTGDTSQSTSSNDRRWSSMLDVDPSKIISLMVKHGGLLLPAHIEKDLKIFSQLCHAGNVKLNIVQKKLLVENFSVQIPGESNKALTVGRLFLTWESYRRPLLELELDNVTITIEFLNVMLTKTNWGEMKRMGFPPQFPETDPSTVPPQQHKNDDTSSFVRVGKVDLSGDFSVILLSKPMKKDLGTFKLSLDTFDELDKEIRFLSEKNLVENGRKGCTTDELYTLIQQYFGRKLRGLLIEVAQDLSNEDGSKTAESVNKIVGSARESVKKYANDARAWTGEKIDKNMSEKLAKWGESVDKLGEPNGNSTKLANAYSVFRQIQDSMKSED